MSRIEESQECIFHLYDNNNNNMDFKYLCRHLHLTKWRQSFMYQVNSKF